MSQSSEIYSQLHPPLFALEVHKQVIVIQAAQFIERAVVDLLSLAWVFVTSILDLLPSTLPGVLSRSAAVPIVKMMRSNQMTASAEVEGGACYFQQMR